MRIDTNIMPLPTPHDPLSAFDLTAAESAPLPPLSLPWHPDPRLVFWINAAMEQGGVALDALLNDTILHSLFHLALESDQAERARQIGGIICTRSSDAQWATFVEVHGDHTHGAETNSHEEESDGEECHS